MKKYTFFAQFQGGWPIHDLMKKVLQNSVNKLKADNRAEALAEEEHRDEDPPIANGKKRKSSERASASESEDEEEEDRDPQADSDDSSDEKEEVSRKGKPQKVSSDFFCYRRAFEIPFSNPSDLASRLPLPR